MPENCQVNVGGTPYHRDEHIILYRLHHKPVISEEEAERCRHDFGFKCVLEIGDKKCPNHLSITAQKTCRSYHPLRSVELAVTSG